MGKLDKQRKISELLFNLRKKSKKKGDIPEFNRNLLNKSPIFTNPQLHIKKFRMIDEVNALKGYKPLNESAIAYNLSSPPRMTHGSRTVVPRDFLIPLRVMKHVVAESTEVNNEPTKKSKKGNNIKLEYIIVPFHPKDAKVAEDPVIYYPNSLYLFETYFKPDSTEIAKINKFSFNPALYPNIKNVDSVAWNRNTSDVVRKILVQLIHEEAEIYESHDRNTQNSVLINEYKQNSSVAIRGNNIIIDGTKFDKGLLKVLKEKIPSLEIPVSTNTITLIRHLIRYTMYINN